MLRYPIGLRDVAILEQLEQESVADAKERAWQQCVYEGPYRRKIQQINDMRFPIDWLLIVTVHGRIHHHNLYYDNCQTVIVTAVTVREVEIIIRKNSKYRTVKVNKNHNIID